jgi:hypothetical protein
VFIHTYAGTLRKPHQFHARRRETDAAEKTLEMSQN